MAVLNIYLIPRAHNSDMGKNIKTTYITITSVNTNYNFAYFWSDFHGISTKCRNKLEIGN